MKGKLCVITGATSGIGRATALALGALGADLVLIGRNEAMGRAVAARIARLPNAGQIEFIRTDLSVQSEGLGKGATFILELPCHRREPEPATNAASSGLIARRSRARRYGRGFGL